MNSKRGKAAVHQAALTLAAPRRNGTSLGYSAPASSPKQRGQKKKDRPSRASAQEGEKKRKQAEVAHLEDLFDPGEVEEIDEDEEVSCSFFFFFFL